MTSLQSGHTVEGKVPGHVRELSAASLTETPKATVVVSTATTVASMSTITAPVTTATESTTKAPVSTTAAAVASTNTIPAPLAPAAALSAAKVAASATAVASPITIPAPLATATALSATKVAVSTTAAAVASTNKFSASVTTATTSAPKVAAATTSIAPVSAAVTTSLAASSKPDTAGIRGPTSELDGHIRSSVSLLGAHSSADGSATDKNASSISGSENSVVGARGSYGVGKPYFGMVFVRSGETLPSSNVHAGASLVPGKKPPVSASQKKANTKAVVPTVTFPPTPEAKPILSKEEYLAAWKAEKDPLLQKFKKLAYEVVALKTARPNAKDKLHSAANRVPIRIEFTTEPVVAFKNNNSFICYVFVERVLVASGRGLKIKDAKTNAYEATLQKILMPHLRVLQLDPESTELEGSTEPFVSPPPEPSKVPLPKSSAKLPPAAAAVAPAKTNTIKEIPSQQKESNLETACLKRRLDEQKPLEDFVIVEPLVPMPDCTPAHTLRRSADFNHMLLEYEYFFKGDAARCVVKIENNVLADVNGLSKMAAKNLAANQALKKLKDICWVIKTKKAVDSDNKISKEDMLTELYDQSEEVIGEENVGNKLLRKMGWYGGGMGKDGSGIVEPVSLSSVLNREGLGLGSKKGITEDFKKQVRQVIENYAASGNQEDLVFSYEFRLDERQIIHDECRRLNLNSKCRGKGRMRYLCVSRKRTANELFDHVMLSGGETARYVLVPPGFDEDAESQSTSNGTVSKAGSKNGDNDKEKNNKGSNGKNTGKGLLPSPGLLGEAPLPPQGMVNNRCGPSAFNQGPRPLQRNPMGPFMGPRFGCPRPDFKTPAPGVQNRFSQPRIGMNNAGNMRFQSGNGMSNQFGGVRNFGNHQLPWGAPVPNNGYFQEFDGQHGNCQQGGMGMGFSEMNSFHNGSSDMSEHGFRNDQSMEEQWGAQDNSQCFQNYGGNHNGFQNEHMYGMGFNGSGNNQGMGNDWENWQNNGYQCDYDYNSGFQNEDMGANATGFCGAGNNPGNQGGMHPNHEYYQNANDYNSGYQNQGMGMQGMGFGDVNNTCEESHGGGNNHSMGFHHTGGYFQNGGMHQNNCADNDGRQMGRSGFRNAGIGSSNMGNGGNKAGMFHQGPYNGGCEGNQVADGGQLPPGGNRAWGQQNYGGGGNEGNMQNCGQFPRRGRGGRRPGACSQMPDVGAWQEPEAGTYR